MPALASLVTFSPNTVALSAQVNANFAALRTWADNSVVMTDVAKTISVTHTFSAAQTFSSTINGQTISSVANFTGSVDIAGVLEVANQLRFEQPASVIKPGSTSLAFRNNADTFDNAVLTDAGVLTVRAGVVVTAGGVTVTAGGLTVTAGGAAITGNSTITGNLTVTGTLSAGTIGLAQFVRRTSSVNFTSSTDSGLTFAIGATEEWEAEYVLYHDNVSAATMTFTPTGPAGVTLRYGGVNAVNSTASVVTGGAETTGGLGGLTMNAVLAVTVVRLYAKGGGTGGNVTVAVTASAGTGAIEAGSFVKYTRIA